MSRILLRAAVSAVLLSASDARKVHPDGQSSLLSTAADLDSRSTLKDKAVATADDAVREAEAQLAKEMSAAEPEAKEEEGKVELKKKEKKAVRKKIAQTADEDFVKDGDDKETVEDEKEEEPDDEEDASEEAGAEDKAEKKDKGDVKKGSAKKDDTKKTATKDSKKETTKAAKKDDKQKETTKVAKKDDDKKETTKAAKKEDKKEETAKVSKDDKKKETSKAAKKDAEPKGSNDAKSDKKEDDKADAKDATQGKKKEAAKQDKAKQSEKKDGQKDQEKKKEKEPTKKDQNKTGTKAETQNKTAEKAKPMAEFGTPKCPCVGFEGATGDLTVSLGKNKTASYPADAFASCAAWDADSHPACEGNEDGDSWCHQPWCVVDPCNCELDIAPKKVTGGYWPDGDVQGMGGYWYSYATCGGKDVWADEDSQKKMTHEPKECDKKVDETKWGDAGCQCIGMAGRLGNVDVQISDNVTASYPIDAGATCKAWDMKNHPDCQGKDPADWCKQVWCYVDPCSCAIPVSPKVSSYMTAATWSGRPVYYSYHTCGGNDTYTKSQENACVNQLSDEECGNQSRCAWDGQQCLGKELVKVCRKAAKAVANASDAEETELDKAAEKEERTAPKKGQEKSGALLPAAPFLATFLAFVASSS